MNRPIEECYLRDGPVVYSPVDSRGKRRAEVFPSINKAKRYTRSLMEKKEQIRKGKPRRETVDSNFVHHN